MVYKGWNVMAGRSWVTAADVFLRRNGFYIEVDAQAGHEFIYGSMDRYDFRFPRILDWIRLHVKPLR